MLTVRCAGEGTSLTEPEHPAPCSWLAAEGPCPVTTPTPSSTQLQLSSGEKGGMEGREGERLEMRNPHTGTLVHHHLHPHQHSLWERELNACPGREGGREELRVGWKEERWKGGKEGGRKGGSEGGRERGREGGRRRVCSLGLDKLLCSVLLHYSLMLMTCT